MNYHAFEYILENVTISALTYSDILKHSSALITPDRRDLFDIQPQTIELNFGLFSKPTDTVDFPLVAVTQLENSILLSCECKTPKNNLCEHQVQVLLNIMDRPHLKVFFDKKLRDEKIRVVAKDYGLENENNPDDFFQLEYAHKSLEIKPKIKELFPVNSSTNNFLKDHLLPRQGIRLPSSENRNENTRMVVVFARHKYYDHLLIELFEAQTSKDGKIKNPLKTINPSDFIWKTENIEELKFYTGISRFQNNYNTGKSEADLEGLKALVKNPLQLDVFYHDAKISENITANSIVPVRLCSLNIDLSLSVNLKENFHEVSGELVVNEQTYPLKNLKIKYDYFIFIEHTLYLIDNPDFLRVIDFFKKQNSPTLLIHSSKFEEFQQNILSKLEHKIRVRYSYLRAATKSQLVEKGFDQALEKIIYLSDLENFVLITPVIKYGTIEVPVLSKKQIYATDSNGNAFTLDRDEAVEIQFTAALLKQHPDFYEQLNNESFYLHKERFLDERWFLEAIETWKQQHITILGFNELKNNHLNPHKGKVSISVSSGIDWFETSLEVAFGKQKVSLKHLHKSIRNKSKFVQLGDGTLGILPQEWIEKFSKYFNSGDILEEKIRTPRNNFSGIAELYEKHMLTKEVAEQLALYASGFSKFKAIQDVDVPKDLQATLREYQKQGLNWLNFLDEFGFGGCLADDMGLGKTIQIIAFILSQRGKQKRNTNLIVVPTSLIFNWQEEIKKFAPSLKTYTTSGSNRLPDSKKFDQYEVVLTTYGMLLSDIRFLKDYHFNYIFLDESQAIKNPESQRYRAACLLQSRNKVVLTGTPIENNTFDLFGQLSFACPGLLGNKQQFKDHYSTPIDRFEDSKRAAELQRRINPFILRRTKKQVATELPEKTEMIIYCEMGTEQRKVYDTYEKEFREYIATRKEEDLPKQSMHILQGLTKLRQICNSPALLKDDEYYGDASSKIETLMEQIENKSEQHKILVFSQFVSMLDLIRKELESRNIAFEYLTGQTKNRASKVEEFQNNEKVRVFLISLKAGGTGLNLTEADYVYLVDPWWNPAVENQAIDRSYRIGQKKNVVAVRLICPDTIEEKIMKLQESKKELADDLIKTDVSTLKLLSKKDLLGLFK